MAQTPNEQKNSAIKSKFDEVALSNGRIAKCEKPKGKHVMKAQRLMDGDPNLMMPALISVCMTIDGKQPAMEDLMEYDASDYFALMTHFGSAFQSGQNT